MRPRLPEGATVRYLHLRRFEGADRLLTRTEANAIHNGVTWAPPKPLPKGGLTICHVVYADGQETAGAAGCHEKDNFSKKLGRDISLGRALYVGKLGAFASWNIIGLARERA